MSDSRRAARCQGDVCVIPDSASGVGDVSRRASAGRERDGVGSHRAECDAVPAGLGRIAP